MWYGREKGSLSIATTRDLRLEFAGASVDDEGCGFLLDFRYSHSVILQITIYKTSPRLK
jgi:hypothetical protein